MPAPIYANLFQPHVLDEIFPADRSDRFFEALFGDADEGAYDISLVYCGEDGNRIDFQFQLDQRPGRCLACNLTFGLPEVFRRHPIIDVPGVIQRIEKAIGKGKRCEQWSLGRTREISRKRHVLPLTVNLTDALTES